MKIQAIVLRVIDSKDSEIKKQRGSIDCSAAKRDSRGPLLALRRRVRSLGHLNDVSRQRVPIRVSHNE
ncbi:hypothetical protein CUMW_110430 [Citrus unshiu]|nr:hypothetical protein CUMW_110430 [Citrus unshiu]